MYLNPWTDWVNWALGFVVLCVVAVTAAFIYSAVTYQSEPSFTDKCFNQYGGTHVLYAPTGRVYGAKDLCLTDDGRIVAWNTHY